MFGEFYKSMFSRERRRAARRKSPCLVAHYWNGTDSIAFEVQDISPNGFYVLAKDLWYPGTQIVVTLQRNDADGDGQDHAITVNTAVVRRTSDGMALEFLPSDSLRKGRNAADALLPDRLADRARLDLFVAGLRTTDGQALIEYLLIIPLLFLLIANAVNFAGLFFAWISVADAARAGADYAILSTASVGDLTPASGSQIQTVITDSMRSLPNRASVVVNVCSNASGTVTALTGTCTSVPADPESPTYALMVVDVTYTYHPFVSTGFNFPALGIYTTLPPTRVYRRAVMRSIQ